MGRNAGTRNSTPSLRGSTTSSASATSDQALAASVADATPLRTFAGSAPNATPVRTIDTPVSAALHLVTASEHATLSATQAIVTTVNAHDSKRALEPTKMATPSDKSQPTGSRKVGRPPKSARVSPSGIRATPKRLAVLLPRMSSPSQSQLVRPIVDLALGDDLETQSRDGAGAASDRGGGRADQKSSEIASAGRVPLTSGGFCASPVNDFRATPRRSAGTAMGVVEGSAAATPENPMKADTRDDAGAVLGGGVGELRRLGGRKDHVECVLAGIAALGRKERSSDVIFICRSVVC